MDPRWSETGDRYLLKLLRDYIFHQVYEDGSPVIDIAHVVECLNKVHRVTSFFSSFSLLLKAGRWYTREDFAHDKRRTSNAGCKVDCHGDLHNDNRINENL